MVPKREIHESQIPTHAPYKPRAFCPRPPSPGEFPKGKFGGDGRGGGRGTPRLATGPRYNVSLCGRVGRFAAGLASVPSSAWFVTRCTENAIWGFGLCPFKILMAKRGTGTQSGFGVDLVANQVWVPTQNFWVACRKCMNTHMIRNPNFGFGTQKWVWRRPCRKSGRHLKTEGEGGDGEERIQERNSATPGAYKRRGGGRGRGEGREAGEQGCQERIQERNSARPGAYKP